MIVKKWEREQKDIRRQEIRQTTYSTGIIDGKKLFQIQTYGGTGSTGSAKQIIQFPESVKLGEMHKTNFTDFLKGIFIFLLCFKSCHCLKMGRDFPQFCLR